MDKVKLEASIFIFLLLLFILLESRDYIEPRQYHAPEQSHSAPWDNSISTVISGTGATGAFLSSSPSPSAGPDDDIF